MHGMAMTRRRFLAVTGTVGLSAAALGAGHPRAAA
jgi:hypothetical protein